MPILTAQERIGTRIGGRYRIERLLARGGMSVLFEARDTRTHRSVAVKVLKTEDSVDERRVARFLQEMRLTAELRDSHVVDVLDLGQDDAGVPYLVMELLHGRSLQAELDARATLGVEEALAALLPVIAALAAVHSAGVVHRDVKPDNIFLHIDGAGRVIPKLLDFGIAKHVTSTFGTRTGAVLGTPDYMAPEQVLGDEVTPATDVWAMGAVLYRTLCGETPFRSATTAQTLAKLAHEPAPLLRAAGVPPALCAAVDRALVREVSGRYSDMNGLAQAIMTCASEAGIPVPDHVRPRAVKSVVKLLGANQRTRGTDPTGGARSPLGNRKPISRFGIVGTGLLGLTLFGASSVATDLPRRGSEGARMNARPSAEIAARAHENALRPRALTPAIAVDETRALPIDAAIEPATMRTAAAIPSAQAETLASPSPSPPALDRPHPRRASTEPRRAPQTTDVKALRLGGLPVAVEW